MTHHENDSQQTAEYFRNYFQAFENFSHTGRFQGGNPVNGSLPSFLQPLYVFLSGHR